MNQRCADSTDTTEEPNVDEQTSGNSDYLNDLEMVSGAD